MITKILVNQSHDLKQPSVFAQAAVASKYHAAQNHLEGGKKKKSVLPPPPRGSHSNFPAPRLCLDSSHDLGQFAQEVTSVVAATSDCLNWERDPLTCRPRRQRQTR